MNVMRKQATAKCNFARVLLPLVLLLGRQGG